MRHNVVLVLVPAIVLALVGCDNKPCQTLENKLCQDLGPFCATWKAHGKPGMPTGDQAEFRHGSRAATDRALIAAGLSEPNADVCAAIEDNYAATMFSIKQAMLAQMRADSIQKSLAPKP